MTAVDLSYSHCWVAFARQEREMDEPTWYEIHLQSELDDSLVRGFAGMARRCEAPGETILYGPLADQAALHGVLMRIRDLGLPLLAVYRVAAPKQQLAANDSRDDLIGGSHVR